MGSSLMWMSLLLPALLLVAAMSAETLTWRDGCNSTCGDVDIPYPFGIGKDCFRKGFEISCTDSVPVLVGTSEDCFVRKGSGNTCNEDLMKNYTTPLRVLSLSLSPHPVARVELPTPLAWQCFYSDGWSSQRIVSVDPQGVYRISSDLNKLVVLGCNIYGSVRSTVVANLGHYSEMGCVAKGDDSSVLQDHVCTGIGCCSIDVPQGLTQNKITIGFDWSWKVWSKKSCPCIYAFIVEKGQYNFTKADLHDMDVNHTMPLSLDWAIRDNGDESTSCAGAKNQTGYTYACLSDHSECVDSENGPGYTCNCTKGYQGNPYVDDGCTDINECEPDNPCKGTCKNTDGGYQCGCRVGYKSSDPYVSACRPVIPLGGMISIGIVAGIFLITITAFIIILRKERWHRNEIYRKNGGPTLEKASIIKLFKKEDLIPILKPSNIIGKGGFGEVYKGLLDGVWVAIKKPISGNQMEAIQFANEVIIQSKVIHKNIVRLIGCCLEVDTPMLVYEFISQGSMDDILHGGEKKHLSLDARLNIAAESAQGLAYMHSQTNIVILHGDVKPANILLDEKSAPKISDFGISRLIARDNEHAASVIGDMTYMDPVYQESGLLTAKSDVYSFGVVILELISRKKATHRDNSNLVNSFLENHKKGVKSTELFDTAIVEGAEDLLQSLTELAIKCLDLDVDQRPTMTEVAEELFALSRSRQV